MAEISARVHLAGELLVANLEADVLSFWVTGALLHAATHLFAFVLHAGLHLVADLLAPERSSGLLFLSHQLVPLVLWVVHGEARHGPLRLPTLAALLDFFNADLALVRVTCLFALVNAAWQKLFALVLAMRNRIGALLSLSADQRLDSVVAAGAEDHSTWVFGARRALAFVASPFAFVLPTVKSFAAELTALLPLASARNSLHLLFAEARLSHHLLTLIALPLVTSLLALMRKTVQKFAASVFASKLGPLS